MNWFPGQFMASRRIFLVRHGDVDYFTPEGKPLSFRDARLNLQGEKEAAALGEFLASAELQRVVVSPLARAGDTAGIILRGRNLEIQVEPRFMEIEPASLQAPGPIPPAQIREILLSSLGPGLTEQSRFFGGEAFGPFLKRVADAWKQLLADSSYDQALIVAHSVVNRAILAKVFGLGLDGLSQLEQDSGCVNVIDLDSKGRGMARLINHTPVNPMKAGLRKNSLEQLVDKALANRG